MLDSGIGSGIGTVSFGYPTLIDTSRWLSIFSVKRFDSIVILYICALLSGEEYPQDVRAELPFTQKSRENKRQG